MNVRRRYAWIVEKLAVPLAGRSHIHVFNDPEKSDNGGRPRRFSVSIVSPEKLSSTLFENHLDRPRSITTMSAFIVVHFFFIIIFIRNNVDFSSYLVCWSGLAEL